MKITRSSRTTTSFLYLSWRRCVVKLCACKMSVLVFGTYSQRSQLRSCSFSSENVRDAFTSYGPSYSLVGSTRSDVVLPLSSPIQDVDGREVHEIFVPKNTTVFPHIYNLNRDPSIWGTDAAEWKPERWLAPLPKSVADANIQGVYANTCETDTFYNSSPLLTALVV